MDIGDRVWSGDAQDVAEANKILVVAGESLASNVRLFELETLDHRPHRTVEDVDTFSDKMK